jgi:hypothetical protein
MLRAEDKEVNVNGDVRTVVTRCYDLNKATKRSIYYKTNLWPFLHTLNLIYIPLIRWTRYLGTASKLTRRRYGRLLGYIHCQVTISMSGDCHVTPDR